MAALRAVVLLAQQVIQTWKYAAVAVYFFNLALDTNFIYLMAKPDQASILDLVRPVAVVPHPIVRLGIALAACLVRTVFLA